MPRSDRLIGWLLLLVQALLLAWHASATSPVESEIPYLPAGISHWKFGRFELYRQNPPLVRLIGAIPAIFIQPKLDWMYYPRDDFARTEPQIGHAFVEANGSQTVWYYFIGRLTCIPLNVFGGWIAWHWATALYGGRCGLLALTLYAFCPNLLGHGALIMPDAPAAAMGLAAGFSFWRWLNEPNWQSALVAGLALGLALLCKSTLLVFVPLWPLIWFATRLRHQTGWTFRKLVREAGLIGVLLVTSCYVLNAGYFFKNTLRPLGQFQFRSVLLGGPLSARDDIRFGNRFAQTILSHFPVPLPADFVLGLDLQKSDFERYEFRSYLRGEWRKQGWWYYYLYFLLVKLPIGTLVLLLISLVICLCAPELRAKNQSVVILSALAILGLISSQSTFSVHGRYALPVLPFLYVFAARAGSTVANRYYWLTTVPAVVATIGSVLYQCPHSLAYFNELAGGPRNGHFHLLDSNISWGQDLLHVRTWQNRHPEARPLYLINLYGINPDLLEIECELPPFLMPQEKDNRGPSLEAGQPHLAPGWYAIDVNYLRGAVQSPYYHPNPRPQFDSQNQKLLQGFLHKQPVALCGYSIYVYHIP